MGITAVAPITMNGVLPANTTVMHEFSTSYSTAQLVLGIYLIATMFSQVILGPLADNIGRRPVMIASLFIFAMGSVLCAVATSIELLLAGRFIQGLGGAVCVFLTRTIMRDVHPEEKAASAIGYMVTAMMVAPLFGPALFGWLTDISSWRYMYVLLALAGFTLTLCSYWFQNETLQPRAKVKQNALQSGGELMKELEFLAYILILCGSVGIYFCFLTGAPYVVMELRDHSATVYGRWFAMVAIGYLVGNFLAGRFSEKIGTRRFITLSMLPLMLGVVLFWVFSTTDHLIGLFLPMQMVALSNGMCLPNLTSAAMSVRIDISAQASGLMGTIQIGVSIVLTFILSAVLSSTDTPLFVVITLCGLAALAGLYTLNKAPVRT